MKSVILLRRRRVLWGTAMAAFFVTSSLMLLSAANADAANPVPYVSQPLVPDAAAPGGPGFTLTVNGTGFVSGSVVNWNGSARATHFVSQGQFNRSHPGYRHCPGGDSLDHYSQSRAGWGYITACLLPACRACGVGCPGENRL